MHPAFANIQFGPFAASYHRETVNDDFKEALSAFLEAELLPQVQEQFDSTIGRLTAAYDDQKYCGPNSAVWDIYRLAFESVRLSSCDSIKVDLVFESKRRWFTTRHRRPFYLWTAARRQQHERDAQTIRQLCGRIAARELSAAVCPRCSASLRIIDSPALFDVSCPSRCFNFNYHRDPATGAFLHGHFFTKESFNTA